MSDVMQRLMKAMTVIQSVEPPRIPDGAHAMTAIIEWGPGDRGAPPHRHPGGPCFGYVLEGEMLFELEGEAGFRKRLVPPAHDVIRRRPRRAVEDGLCRRARRHCGGQEREQDGDSRQHRAKHST